MRTTALPGVQGNCVMSAHRELCVGKLEKLRIGDVPLLTDAYAPTDSLIQVQ